MRSRLLTVGPFYSAKNLTLQAGWTVNITHCTWTRLGPFTQRLRQERPCNTLGIALFRRWEIKPLSISFSSADSYYCLHGARRPETVRNIRNTVFQFTWPKNRLKIRQFLFYDMSKLPIFGLFPVKEITSWFLGGILAIWIEPLSSLNLSASSSCIKSELFKFIYKIFGFQHKYSRTLNYLKFMQNKIIFVEILSNF